MIFSQSEKTGGNQTEWTWTGGRIDQEKYPTWRTFSSGNRWTSKCRYGLYAFPDLAPEVWWMNIGASKNAWWTYSWNYV